MTITDMQSHDVISLLISKPMAADFSSLVGKNTNKMKKAIRTLYSVTTTPIDSFHLYGQVE